MASNLRCLRKLLGFGKVSYYLGYAAMHDFFPTMRLKPNPSCEDANCRARQAEAVHRPPTPQDEELVDTEAVVHEENDWGISVVAENEPTQEDSEVAAGLHLAYSIPAEQDDTSNTVLDTTTSLEELMRQMKSM